MIASQWSPGTSLYGDYWVDRPPLMIGVYQVAVLLGGDAVGVRLLGVVCVAGSVLLAGLLGRETARLDTRRPERADLVPVVTATTALVFLVSPLFGAMEVDGELLAVPLVLAGLVALLRTLGSSPHRSLAWWATAGVLGVAAAGVKQNMLEVFVAGAVLLVGRRQSRSRALLSGVSFVGGAAVAAAALIGWAWWHGTSPAGLWDAVVAFRVDAARVIAQAGPSDTGSRAVGVAGAFVASGALGLAAVALGPVVLRLRTRRPTLLEALTVAVLAWELVGVVLGGSYWLHYLVGTVPGLVLAAAVAVRGGARRRVTPGGLLAYAAVVTVGGVVFTALSPIGTAPEDLAVEHYLATHKHPGDTGVVAFGDPALLRAAGLSSPYPELWSLPVRVRDPDLAQFTSVLMGPERPAWVVVNGSSLASWGVDPSRARPVLHREYREVEAAGDWHIYLVRTEDR